MSRRESSAVQGIAVLMMMFHHFFLYAWMFPEGFLAFPERTQQLAWCGRMCVGMFSFVSGVGIFHLLKDKASFAAGIKPVLIRILRLYIRLWLAMALSIILPALMLGEEIKWAELPGNLLATDPTYNNTWWYVREYACMLIAAPFMAVFFRGDKKNRLILAAVGIILAAAAAALLFIPGLRPVLDFIHEKVELIFLIIFGEGYLAAFLQDTVKKRKDRKPEEEKRVRLIFGAAGLFAVIIVVAVRYLFTATPSEAKQDIVLVPVLIWGLVRLMRVIKPFLAAADYFGKHSTYIWLVHGAVWMRCFEFLTAHTVPVVYYLVIAGLSLAAAYLFELIEKAARSLTKKDGNDKLIRQH